MTKGVMANDRTGVGTISSFGHSFKHNLSRGFPLMTHKKVSFRSVMAELVWFLSGSTDNNELRKLGATIWDEWANDDGQLGPIYGHQWRTFNGVGRDDCNTADQITSLIHEIINNPDSRRLIVSAWNPLVLPNTRVPISDSVEDGKQALAPCHVMFQVYVKNDTMDLMWTQRSVDIVNGLPFNIASYAMLLYILCAITGYKPGHVIGSFGDVHVYNNHLTPEIVGQIKTRKPFPLPRVHDDVLSDYFRLPVVTRKNYDTIAKHVDKWFNKNASTTVKVLTGAIYDYKHHDAIKSPVAV